MRQRYFDSAATTRPKAPGVSEAAADFLDRVCCNIGRGDYQSAYDAENVALLVGNTFADAQSGWYKPAVDFAQASPPMARGPGGRLHHGA